MCRWGLQFHFLIRFSLFFFVKTEHKHIQVSLVSQRTAQHTKHKVPVAQRQHHIAGPVQPTLFSFSLLSTYSKGRQDRTDWKGQDRTALAIACFLTRLKQCNESKKQKQNRNSAGNNQDLSLTYIIYRVGLCFLSLDGSWFPTLCLCEQVCPHSAHEHIVHPHLDTCEDLLWDNAF